MSCATPDLVMCMSPDWSCDPLLCLPCRRAQEEQERRDYELALRLAQDENQAQANIIETTTRPLVSRIARRSLRRSDQYTSKQQEAVRKKYDLSKWKYAELRDTINTSVGGCGMWVW